MLQLPSHVEVTRDYGPLRAGLNFGLDEGYSVLIGENNAGKSALLQYLFIESQRGEIHERSTILLSNRSVLTSQLVPATDLRNWNNNFFQAYSGQPKDFGNYSGPAAEQLHSALMHGSLLSQLNEFSGILESMGFPGYEVVGMQQQVLQGRPVSNHGSGLRSIFPIIAAITNPRLNLIFIDEPEFALEPRVQKKLRDLFLQRAENGKSIVVATHSHLFVNRARTPRNYEMVKGPEGVSIRRLGEERDLLDISFNLLGNSISDLFFPENFLIVEGASDQVLTDRVKDLLEIPSTRVKVFSATSLTRIEGTAEALRVALRPLVAGYSPYSSKVVCMVDKPGAVTAVIVDELRITLGDRLVVLGESSLEEYLPAELYAAAGRDKEQDIRALKLQKDVGNHAAEEKLKADISNAISASMTPEHLPYVPHIVEAVRKAAEPDKASTGTPPFAVIQGKK